MVLFDSVSRIFRVCALAEGSLIWRRQPFKNLVPEWGVMASYQDDWQLGSIARERGCLSASSCKLKVMHIWKPALGPGVGSLKDHLVQTVVGSVSNCLDC